MERVVIDFENQSGKIKPMNAVNNGPVGSVVRGTSNIEYFKEAEIPYIRNHDAAHYYGQFTVDIHRIFRNFDADENDPESYNFIETDTYTSNIEKANSKTFYRLGASIEHKTKDGTFPPKDFPKWARICEHVILHYTQGWANGFYYDIEYWEVWNEPDCRNPDGSNPCWQGTDEEFLELFDITVRYLKEKFPKLKIGGPALCTVWSDISHVFIDGIVKRKTPIDFFSYHWYGSKLSDLRETLQKAREIWDGYDYKDIELILDEWNYIKGWNGEEWKYSLRQEKSLKGSSFIAGAMAVGQSEPLDMLMYYDARPCGMNGMFNTDTLEPLYGYYPFLMFKDIKKLGNYIKTENLYDEGIYICASASDTDCAVMLTHYNDDDETEEKLVCVDFKNTNFNEPMKAEFYVLDENNKMILTKEEIVSNSNFSLYVKMPLFTTYLIKLSKMN